MDSLRREFVYSSTGRQRPVFFGPKCAQVKFAVEVQGGDAVRVEVTHDPVEVVKKGGALWEPYEGGEAGGVYGATALRVLVDRLDGWVKLCVEEMGNE